MEYTVVIEKRHCEGRFYTSNKDCPLCAAIREQLPYFNLNSVGGFGLHDKDGVRYMFDNSLGYGWNSDRIKEILSGKIKSFTLSFSAQMPNEPLVQVSDTTKLIVAPSAGSINNFKPVTFEKIKVEHSMN